MKIQLLAICLLTASLTFAAQESNQGKLSKFLQKLQALGKKKDKKEKAVAPQPPQERPQPAICAFYQPNGVGYGGFGGTRTLQNGTLVEADRAPESHQVCRYHNYEFELPTGMQASDDIYDCTCNA